MRFNLTRKIFIIFFSFLLITVFMSIAVFTMIKKIKDVNNHIIYIKDYELVIKDVNAINDKLNVSNANQYISELDSNLRKLEQYFTHIKTHKFGKGLINKIKQLLLQLKYYNIAVNGLYSKLKLNYEFFNQNENLLKQILYSNEFKQKSEIRDIFNTVYDLNIKMKSDFNLKIIREIKDIEKNILSLNSESPVRMQLLSIIKNFKGLYVSFIEIQDRKVFLHDTTEQFLNFGQDFIQIIKNISKKLEKQIFKVALSAIISLIFIIFLWFFLVLKYFNIFLKNQNLIINSINDERYDYILPYKIPDDELGDLTKFMKIMAEKIKENIETLKARENELKILFNYNETILNSMADAVAIIDVEDWIIKKANPAFLNLVCLDKNNVIGNNCFKVTHGIDTPCFQNNQECPVYKLKETGFSEYTEHIYHDKNNKTIFEEIIASPVLNEENKLKEVIYVARDITQKKNMEAKLLQSQKLESIGRLAGGVAHDFNNLLSLILGYAELAIQDINDTELVKDSVHHIIQSGKKAAALTNQLLVFSRKQILKIKPINLKNVLENAKNMIERLLTCDNKLEIKITSKSPIIKGDANQMEQIFMNLVLNAKDSMHNGGKLTIEINDISFDEKHLKEHPDIKQNNYVEIIFSDTGKGMDKDTLSKIFEPFFTTKEKEKGTGLGLSIIYGIIKQHNGFINVYSNVGIGTTLKIYFPLIKEFAEENNPSEDKALCGNESILIVDDNLSLLELASKFLISLGYKVYTAGNGEDALTFLKNKKPDMLITDIVMSGISGIELGEKVYELYPDIKMIFMSGFTYDHKFTGTIKIFSKNFIYKPIMPSNLSKIIRRVFDNNKM